MKRHLEKSYNSFWCLTLGSLLSVKKKKKKRFWRYFGSLQRVSAISVKIGQKEEAKNQKHSGISLILVSLGPITRFGGQNLINTKSIIK